MIQYGFTARELFCMAYLTQKKKMYGIPDQMGTDRQAMMQSVIDSLIDKQIAVMDMDGHVSLADEYCELISFVSDCRKCLTINIQKEDQTTQSVILWKYNGRYLMAEAIGERYVMSAVDQSMIRAMTPSVIPKREYSDQTAEAVIPRIELVKAKRFCQSGKQEDAIRVLRQNGADERLASAIAEGLSERAYYLGILYMDVKQDECAKMESAFLSNQDVLLQLSQTIVNFRTCAVFSEVTSESMQNAIAQTIENFLNES